MDSRSFVRVHLGLRKTKRELLIWTWPLLVPCGSSRHMEVVGPRSASAIPKQETCFTTIRRHFIGSGRSQAVWISPGPEEYVYAGKYRPRKSPLISYRSPVISVSSNGGGRLRWTQWLIDGSFWAQIWTRDTLGDASAQMTELLCEPVQICAQNEPSISHWVHLSLPPELN